MGIVFSAANKLASIPGLTRVWHHSAVLACCLTGALILWLTMGGLERPVVALMCDAGVIASIAAAYDHPDYFARDSVLSNQKQFEIYVAFHAPATRALARLTGDYGAAFRLLIIPVYTIYGVAFYYLGVSLFQKPSYGLLLLLLNLIHVKGPRDTAWGPFPDALPRVAHAALFAMMVAVLWHWRNKPGRWWALFAAAAAGVYVHPVSTPAALAMLTFACLAIGWRAHFLRRAVLHVGIGLAMAALLLAPFGLTFAAHELGSSVSAAMPDPAEEIAQIVQTRFAWGYLSPLRTIYYYFTRPEVLLIAALGAVSAGCLLTFVRNASSTLLATLCGGMLVGLMVAAACIPVLLELTTATIEFAGFKGELTRPLRYVIPISYLPLLGAVHAGRTTFGIEHRFARVAFWVALVLIGLVAFLAAYGFFQKYIHGEKSVAVQELVIEVKNNVPVGTPVLAVMIEPLPIRYAALRPLYFALKDIPSRTDLDAAREWHSNAQRMRELLNESSLRKRLNGSVDWAKASSISWLIIEVPEEVEIARSEAEKDVPHGATVVFSNKHFLLLRL